MGLVDVDPLAVLPVTAASASVGFARASDPRRDDAERRQQLTILEVRLAAVRKLLDSCEQETARLAGQLDRPVGEAPYQGAQAVSDHCRRCSSTVETLMGSARCPDAAAVVLRDLTGDEQALCLRHAAAAVRQVHHLLIVAASRHSRAVLGESAAGSCLVSRRLDRLADAAAASP